MRRKLTLFKKLLRHLFPAPHDGVGPFEWPMELLKSQKVELVLVEVHCDTQSILQRLISAPKNKGFKIIGKDRNELRKSYKDRR